MRRIAEPELMDEADQARAYSEADFAEAHQRFIDQIAARFGPLTGEVVDLGCGPADPTVRLALANPEITIVGVDAGPTMLKFAAARVEAAGLSSRIRFEQRHLPDPELSTRPHFDAVVSNSLLHHLPDPTILWKTIAACARPGAPVAVMDLMRPDDEPSTENLVARYASDAPAVLRADFHNSLLAAYRVDEVAAQLEQAALRHFNVEPISDRHLLVTGRR
ncbi:MAG TPA: class I SAM-dependent methyltransferase [Acidimicrobiales bacterium]